MAGFFDKIGKTITDTTHSVVEKTKTSTDTMRLNGQINDEERKIQQAYQSIGKKYVEMYAKSPDSEMAEDLEIIRQSREKIASYQEQVRKNKRLVVCSSCGAEIPETVLYCTRCGGENPTGRRLAEEKAAREAAEREAAAQAQREREAAMQANIQRCPSCGNPLIPGSQFCTSCGAKCGAPVQPAPAPQPVAQPVPQPVAQPVPQPVPQPAPAPQPVSQPGMQTCPNCNSQMPVENRFCTVCGGSLAPAPVPAAPAEVAPAETAPVETVPAETAPVEVTLVETTPAEAAPAETAPVEETPAEVSLEESAPAVEQPVESAPIETAPAEETPAAEPAPAEESSADSTEQVCPVCGKVLPPENLFCTGCGTKLS